MLNIELEFVSSTVILVPFKKTAQLEKLNTPEILFTLTKEKATLILELNINIFLLDIVSDAGKLFVLFSQSVLKNAFKLESLSTLIKVSYILKFSMSTSLLIRKK